MKNLSLKVMLVLLCSVVAYAATEDAGISNVDATLPQVFRAGIYVGSTTKNPESTTQNKLTGVLGYAGTIRWAVVPDGGSCAIGTPDKHFNDYDGGLSHSCTECQTDGGLGVFVPGVRAGDVCQIASSAPAAWNFLEVDPRCRVEESNVVVVKRCTAGQLGLAIQPDAGVFIRVFSGQ